MPPTKRPLPAKPMWLDVDPMTRPRECDGQNCRATIFFAINPATGRRVPVDCDVDGGQRPSQPGSSERIAGRGVSHFQTCPDAGRFSRNPK